MKIQSYPKPVRVKESQYERLLRYRRKAKITQRSASAKGKKSLLRKKRVKVSRPVGKIRKEVESLAKLVAKQRDKWTCQHCGKKVEGSNAHGSHVIPVSRGNALRFDPMNIICLCYHCHINWWHKNPVESGEWFRKTFPELWAHIEPRKDSKGVKFTYEDYETMKIKLQGIIDKYGRVDVPSR